MLSTEPQFAGHTGGILMMLSQFRGYAGISIYKKEDSTKAAFAAFSETHLTASIGL
jgi:hypothetical protein